MPALPATAPMPAAPAAPAAPGSTAPARSRAIRWLGYAAFWLLVGSLLGLAEWEKFSRGGQPRAWQPFLWEISSAVVVGGLAVVVHRWNGFLARPSVGMARRVAGHLAGALAFTLAHTTLMYAARFAVYGLVGATYETGSAATVLAYEAPKDAVTYALVLVMSAGLRAFLREQGHARRLAEVNEQLVQARLAQLQAHVQPHFLFNTLNLVSSVMHEDVGRADRILCDLADLLRHSLDAGRLPVQPLSRELDWVSPFLEIMRQRFGDRLTASVAVDEAAAACEVPTLLLMTPVENAVKHGVARVRGPARLHVAAQVRDGRLGVEVSNTCGGTHAGADPDVDAPGLPGATRGGTGLADLRARLATLYGADASATLRRAGGTALLVLDLPARRATS